MLILPCSISVKGVVWDGGDKVADPEVCGGTCPPGFSVTTPPAATNLFTVCLTPSSDVWIFCMAELNALDELPIWSFSLDISDFIWGCVASSASTLVVMLPLLWMADISLLVVILSCSSWRTLPCSWTKVLTSFSNDVTCNFKAAFSFESLSSSTCILISWSWIPGGISPGFDGPWWLPVVVGRFVAVENVGRVVETNGSLMNPDTCDVYPNKTKNTIWLTCMLC